MTLHAANPTSSPAPRQRSPALLAIFASGDAMMEGLWLGNDADANDTIQRLERLLADLKAYRAGSGPTERDLSEAPLLEGWQFKPYMTYCLGGYVYGHPMLGSAREIHTSMLFALNESQHWARTFSRYYRLGKSLTSLRDAVDAGLTGKR